MDRSEMHYLKQEKCFFAHDIHKDRSWMEESIGLLTGPVYLTIDLDVLDPAIMPSTGTPEPGGMDWYLMIEYLRKVFKAKNVIGFDLVEFAPIEPLKAPDSLVAKLYYKLLSYKFSS